jgi:hypothetical protein
LYLPFQNDKKIIQKYILDYYKVDLEEENINKLIYYLRKIYNNIVLINKNMDNLRDYIGLEEIIYRKNSIIV